MDRLFTWFVKLTGAPVQYFCFRTKVFYDGCDKSIKSIKGPAIIVSNHTSVFDFPVFMFVFWRRSLRYIMAEVLFKKKLLGWFLKKIGGIRVDRYDHDFSFMDKALRVLDKGGVVGIFPEARLPLPGEKRPLPFKPGVSYLAIESGVPVIPVYTNGSYFVKKRACVCIGRCVYARDLYDDALSKEENIARITNIISDKIVELGVSLDEKEKKNDI